MRRTTKSFARDTMVGTLVVAGLYGLAFGVQFPPLQIPGYLLIVGFGSFEVLAEPAGVGYSALFALYLLALGTAGAIVITALRQAMGDIGNSGWRVGVAGAPLVVGVLSLAFALSVLLRSSQLVPVLITGATGLVFLGLAGWLVGLFDGTRIAVPR